MFLSPPEMASNSKTDGKSHMFNPSLTIDGFVAAGKHFSNNSCLGMKRSSLKLLQQPIGFMSIHPDQQSAGGLGIAGQHLLFYRTRWGIKDMLFYKVGITEGGSNPSRSACKCCNLSMPALNASTRPAFFISLRVCANCWML